MRVVAERRPGRGEVANNFWAPTYLYLALSHIGGSLQHIKLLKCKSVLLSELCVRESAVMGSLAEADHAAVRSMLEAGASAAPEVLLVGFVQVRAHWGPLQREVSCARAILLSEFDCFECCSSVSASDLSKGSKQAISPPPSPPPACPGRKCPLVDMQIGDALASNYVAGHENSSVVLGRLWALDPDTLMRGMCMLYERDAAAISRILDVAQACSLHHLRSSKPILTKSSHHERPRRVPLSEQRALCPPADAMHLGRL